MPVWMSDAGLFSGAVTASDATENLLVMILSICTRWGADLQEHFLGR